MNLLRRFLRALTAQTKSQQSSKTPSQDIVDAVAESGESITNVINQSIEIAESTSNLDTKVSRVRVARERLEELKQLSEDYPFVKLDALLETEETLERLERECREGWDSVVDGNMKGQAFEKEGRVDEAIGVYERLVEHGADTPHTYRRLAILYRKQKDTDNELRVLDRAIQAVPESNAKHHAWFVNRREKLATQSQTEK